MTALCLCICWTARAKFVAGVNTYPLEHAYRTYEWKPSETIITSIVLDIPASVRAGAYSLELGMYSPFDFERIPTMSTRHRCGLPARLCRKMCRFALQNCKRAATQCGWEMFAPVTQRRAAVEVGHGGVVDNRALLLEFQLAP